VNHSFTAASSERSANGLESAGFRALQQLVAERHHVLLSPDDPVAMLQTVNELLVQQTAAGLEQAQAAALESFARELALATSEWKREAKTLAERTLEAARRLSATQVEEATAELLTVLARERDRTKATLRRTAVIHAFVLIALLATLGRLWLR
jgi:hypothetical protein